MWIYAARQGLLPLWHSVLNASPATLLAPFWKCNAVVDTGSHFAEPGRTGGCAPSPSCGAELLFITIPLAGLQAVSLSEMTRSRAKETHPSGASCKNFAAFLLGAFLRWYKPWGDSCASLHQRDCTAGVESCPVNTSRDATQAAVHIPGFRLMGFIFTRHQARLVSRWGAEARDGLTASPELAQEGGAEREPPEFKFSIFSAKPVFPRSSGHAPPDTTALGGISHPFTQLGLIWVHLYGVLQCLLFLSLFLHRPWCQHVQLS